MVTAGRLAAGEGGANGAEAGHVVPVDTDKVGRSLTNSSAEITRKDCQSIVGSSIFLPVHIVWHGSICFSIICS